MTGGARARRVRRAILVAAGVGLAAAVGFAWHAERWLRDRIAAVLADRLARPVTLDSAAIDVGGEGVRLTLRGLRIGDPASLAIGSFTLASASIAGALRGEFESVWVLDASLRMARDPAGRLVPGWAFGAGVSAEGAGGGWPRLRIENLVITLDRSLGAEGEIRLPLLGLAAGTGSGAELAFEATAGLTAPVRVQAHASGRARVVRGEAGRGMALEALSVDFGGRAEPARIDGGRLDVSRVSAAGDRLRGEEIGISARMASSDGARAGMLGIYMPVAELGAGRVSIRSLGLSLRGESAPAGDALALGVVGFASDDRAIHADRVRMALSAATPAGRIEGTVLGNLRAAAGPSGVAVDPFEFSVQLRSGDRPPVLSTGRGALAADWPLAEARFTANGQVDASPLAIRGDWRADADPPWRISARIDRLVLAGAPGASAAAGAPGDWRRLPLDLELDVGRLVQGDIELRDARLRYRPVPAQRRAE